MKPSKTGYFMHCLRSAGRLTLADAVSRISESQVSALIRRGEVVRVWDENPDYGRGISGKKPFCFWLEPGPVVVDRTSGRAPRSGDLGEQRRVKRAIALLSRHGYTVMGPDK